MPSGTSKGRNASKLVQTGSRARGVLILGGATTTPPDNRGKREKRGKDGGERRWWEEGCDSVVMDAQQSTLGDGKAMNEGQRQRQWMGGIV